MKEHYPKSGNPIDPEDYFDAINISIPGIDESTVKGSPKLSDVANQIYKYLDDHVCVCHTHFDRVAIRQAFDKYPRCGKGGLLYYQIAGEDADNFGGATRVF